MTDHATVLATDPATFAEQVAVYPHASFKARLRSRLVAAASRTARSAAGEQAGRTTSPTTTRRAGSLPGPSARNASSSIDQRTPGRPSMASSSASTNHQK